MSEVRQVVVGIPGAPGLAPDRETPVLLLAFDLAASATTALADCGALNLSGVRTLMLSVTAIYAGGATAGVRVHVRTAPIDDFLAYDTVDWDTWDLPLVAGGLVQQSHSYETCPGFIRVLIENLDAVEVVPYLDVIATIGA